MRDWWGSWTRSEKLKLAGVVVAIFGLVVAWQSNQEDDKSTSPTNETHQSTSGDGSPAINDTDGNVIINITSPNVE